MLFRAQPPKPQTLTALSVLTTLAIMIPSLALGHTIEGSDANFVQAIDGPAIGPFIYLGAKHMVTGYDHLLFLVGVIGIFTQPMSNTLSRMNETEADHYSYEMVDLPDGMASALVKTAEYRNPRPGKLEEWLFYTHPSVEQRVRAAMEWKASHP